MIVPQRDVQGGIASVTSGYYGSRLETDFDVIYVESYRDGSKWQKLLKALAAYRQFRKVLRTFKPDLIHIHSSFGPSFYRKMPFILMAERAGIPVVNHIHGSAMDEFYNNAGTRKQKLVRKIYGKCACIITLTPHWQKIIQNIAKDTKVVTVPNYSILHEETAQPAARDKRFAKKQILFLGKIDEAKGVYEIPAVMDRVCREFPEAVFYIAGSGDLEGVRERTPEDLRKNLVLPGWIVGEEKTQALWDSAVFFLPSHMEAMPVSALDAMGYGLPVVSTNVGGIPDVVSDGGNGTLTAVGDTEKMAEALLALLRDRALWEKMSDESLAIVRERFSLDAHIAQLEEIYEEAFE